MGNKNKGLSFSTWWLEGKSSKSTTGGEGLKGRKRRVASWGDAPSLPQTVLWNQTLACHLPSHHLCLICSGKLRSREEAPDPSAQPGICPGKEGAQQTLRKLPDQRKPPPSNPPGVLLGKGAFGVRAQQDMHILGKKGPTYQTVRKGVSGQR